MDDLLAHKDDSPFEIETKRDDVAFWSFTSGTTGLPKVAVHLHHDFPYPVFFLKKVGVGMINILIPHTHSYHACTHKHTRMHTCRDIHTHKYSHALNFTLIHSQTHIHSCIHSYTQEYAHIHIQMYTYTLICTLILK